MPAHNCTSSIECDFGEMFWALETEEAKWKPTGFVFVFSFVMLLPFWHQHSQLWSLLAVGFALIKLLTLKKYKTLFRKAILKFNNHIWYSNKTKRHITTYDNDCLTSLFSAEKIMQHGRAPTSFSETNENVPGRSWREPNNTVIGSFCFNLIFTWTVIHTFMLGGRTVSKNTV